MAVTYQIDFAVTGCGKDLLDLGQQLFAPYFGAVGGGHLGHMHAGPVFAQRAGYAIKHFDRANVVKAK